LTIFFLNDYGRRNSARKTGSHTTETYIIGFILYEKYMQMAYADKYDWKMIVNDVEMRS
jgi:fructose-bisphosphate aldolase class 1